MNMQRNNLRAAGTMVLGFALGLGAVLGTTMSSAMAQTAPAVSPQDQKIQDELQKALDNKRFKDVKVSAQNGVATLFGTVDLYADKEDADKKAHHFKDVKGVDNQIAVAGPAVEDATLQKKLAEKLAYDRVGYGTTAFNAITIGVQNGVVTLAGSAYGPMDKDSALSVAANTPGVKDVVDDIQVDPISPMDDRIRLAVARAVYGTPQLSKYGMDPAKPIRITVVNGNVTLSGVVDTKMDHDIANIRANGVPGVFKVTNNLQIAGERAGN